jgi:hypothetical protein
MSVTRDPETERLLPNVAIMPFELQGTSNGCGTTSLAMVMTYLGVPETKDAIDSVIRQTDIYSSPEDLMAFARDHGLQAQGYNHGMWADIEQYVTLGIPCILLINYSGLHYVVAVGYGVDSADGQRYAILHNPQLSSFEYLHEADLIAMGNNITLISVNWGFADYYMAFATRKQPPLPPGNRTGIQGALGAVEGIANAANGLNTIISAASAGDEVHGITQVIGGGIGAIICGLGAIVQKAGNWLTGETKGIPILGYVVPPIGSLVSGLGAVAGDLGDGVDNVINELGEGAGKDIDDITKGITGAGRHIGGALGALGRGDLGGFLNGLGGAIGDVIGAAGDAASDTADAVGSALGSAADAVGDAASDAADAVGDAIGDLF